MLGWWEMVLLSLFQGKAKDGLGGFGESLVVVWSWDGEGDELWWCLCQPGFWGFFWLLVPPGVGWARSFGVWG